MDNPPPTPPPKITIQPDEQATPKATQIVFNIATVARKAPSVNSFTGNGSFLGLPEEADMFYSSNAVWGDLNISQDQQASHKKCAATQHLSPTNVGQQKRLKVADLQFEDADSEAGRTNGKGNCDLNDTMEKSEPLDKPLPHLPDDNGPSEYSISTYSQWSAVILKATRSPDVSRSPDSRPLPQWKSSTPRRSRRPVASTNFCDELVEDGDEQDVTVANQTNRSSSEREGPRQEGEL